MTQRNIPIRCIADSQVQNRSSVIRIRSGIESEPAVGGGGGDERDVRCVRVCHVERTQRLRCEKAEVGACITYVVRDSAPSKILVFVTKTGLKMV